MAYTEDEPLPVAIFGGASITVDNTDVLNALEEIRLLLAAPVESIGYRSLYFFEGLTQTSDLDQVKVTVPSATPVSLEASDADEAWALFAWELSFSAACDLTFEGGAEDYVIAIPTAGIYSGIFREFPYCQTTVAQALTITVSAGTAKGAVYAAKGA